MSGVEPRQAGALRAVGATAPFTPQLTGTGRRRVAARPEKEKTRPAQGLSGRIVGLLNIVPDGSVGLLVVFLPSPEQGDIRTDLFPCPYQSFGRSGSCRQASERSGKGTTLATIACWRFLLPRVRVCRSGAPRLQPPFAAHCLRWCRRPSRASGRTGRIPTHLQFSNQLLSRLLYLLPYPRYKTLQKCQGT
jgi:hypothetical protein